MPGIFGKMLVIDLSSGEIGTREIGEDLFDKFIGGSGLAAHLMLTETRPEEIDPLGPENDLFFLAGLLTSTNAPSGCKINICAKSPLTGIWGESVAGGYWPSKFRSCGIDGVVFRGISERPVYLHMDDNGAELKDASDLWGKTTYETHSILTERHGSRGEVLSIGPAGEWGSLIASVMLDGEAVRACGRTGMGAVMGSKRLKAIYANGTKRPPVADAEAFRAVTRRDIPVMREGAKGLTDWSTAGGVEAVEFHGDLAIKNWSLGAWQEGAKKIAAQAYHPRLLERHHTCFSCPIRCVKIVKIVDTPHIDEAIDDLFPRADDGSRIKRHGPEYETTAGFGSNILVDDPEAIIVANDLCNKLGLDTISASAVIAWVYESFDRGIMTKDDLDGLEPVWGDPRPALHMLKKIGLGTGIGRILGLGTKKAAEKVGRGSERWAVHVKGLEVAFHDPRAFVSMAPNYATASRGGCHLDALSYFVGRGVAVPDLGYTGGPREDHESGDYAAELCYRMQNYMSLFNSLGLCKFEFIGKMGPSNFADWVNALTGWGWDKDSTLERGERLVQLKRIYNNRCGITRKDDILPPRLAEDAKPDGAAAGVLPDTEKMLDYLYDRRGWDENGVVTGETKKRFGLEAY